MWKASCDHTCLPPVSFHSSQVLFSLTTQLLVRAPVKLLGGSPVEALQFHSTTQSHPLSSGWTVCFPSRGSMVWFPGILNHNGTGFLLLALSSYRLFNFFDICYSDNGRIYVILKIVIPKSEEFWIDIRIHSDILSQNTYSHPLGMNPCPLVSQVNILVSHCADLWTVGCRISDKSSFWYRYNVRLRSLLSDSGGSNIRLRLISLIMDIWLSAHLCLKGLFHKIFGLGFFYISEAHNTLTELKKWKNQRKV